MDNSINVDKAAHRIWDFHRQQILDSNTPIYGEWKVFYHEERLYSVYNSKRHIISLVFANSMHDAVRRVIGSEKGGDEGMILFMANQQVKHDGKMWDIEEMTEKGGQTIAHLKHGDDRAEVGIEELEAEQ